MNAEADRDLGPEPQSPEEICSLLEKHCRDGIPCQVLYDHDDDICFVTCFVASVHSDFTILAAIAQASWINGWRALRLHSIIRVNQADDADFILRAMMATGTSLPLQPPVVSETFLDFLRGICQEFAIVTTDDDPARTNDGAAGTIIEVNHESITIRAMSTDGFWEPEPNRIELKHITHVIFGGRYECILERIADLPDA